MNCAAVAWPADPCSVIGYPQSLIGSRVFVNLRGSEAGWELRHPLALRNLVLYNLAPGGMALPGSEAMPPLTGPDSAWANSTLPLWLFKFPRWAAFQGDGSDTTATPTASSTRIVLDNVTLVIPELEWRALAAAVLQPLSYDHRSGTLVLAAARHYGWEGTNVTITYALPSDAPWTFLYRYPDIVLPYEELAGAVGPKDKQQGTPFGPSGTPGGGERKKERGPRQLECDSAAMRRSIDSATIAATHSSGATGVAATLKQACRSAVIGALTQVWDTGRERTRLEPSSREADAQAEVNGAGGGPDVGIDDVGYLRNLSAEIQEESLQVHALLGQGAGSVAYQGLWRGLPVAVKTLVVSDAAANRTEGPAPQRAVLEAAISMSMDHPNVVATYTYVLKPLVHEPQAAEPGQREQPGTENGRPPLAGPDSARASGLDAMESEDAYKLYIVQELCNGGSLRQALDNILLSYAEMKAQQGAPVFAVESSSALSSAPTSSAAALDRSGLVPLIAKVADFGLSLPLAQGATHASQRFVGTPAYAAPEVFADGRVSPRSDVWSFGLILLELYYGCTVGELRDLQPAAALEADASSLQHLYQALLQDVTAYRRCYGELVGACLSVDPHARPEFANITDRLQEEFNNCTEAGTTIVTRCA
ncbi:hypothetical protein GPECTOR_19g191 [Gonium pectorale]|uniref:Protein kinase domain-containing protein n=1 Tax=Gonium pectorale TaxID=33097 RepID=A0A150GJX6_GONPE|nr:hypothetical protein GPECTOR_19g191 [Gonium pectorale]|eukprot:KXZ49740.1 hypothetical protein GPECTOR_19g191 [Gonium pectorale]